MASSDEVERRLEKNPPCEERTGEGELRKTKGSGDGERRREKMLRERLGDRSMAAGDCTCAGGGEGFDVELLERKRGIAMQQNK